MVLMQGPTGLDALAVAGGGGGAGCFDETPGNWNGINVSFAGSSSGIGNASPAQNFTQTLLGGQTFSGGSGGSVATRLSNAGRAIGQLPESQANNFGNGQLLDLGNISNQSDNTFLSRTGGLSIQGGGGGGGGFVGGGAGCAIIKNPKSSTGGGGGLS